MTGSTTPERKNYLPEIRELDWQDNQEMTRRANLPVLKEGKIESFQRLPDTTNVAFTEKHVQFEGEAILTLDQVVKREVGMEDEEANFEGTRFAKVDVYIYTATLKSYWEYQFPFPYMSRIMRIDHCISPPNYGGKTYKKIWKTQGGVDLEIEMRDLTRPPKNWHEILHVGAPLITVQAFAPIQIEELLTRSF